MELTTRDFEILEYLYHQGVATPGQLSQRFFQSNASARVRLHQLKKNGFLDSKPLTDLKTVSQAVYQSPRNKEIFGAKSGLHKFRIYTLGPRIRQAYPRSDLICEPIMWKHQIQLNRIRSFLEKIFPKATILSDPEIREYWSQFRMGQDEVIPDLEVRMDNFKVAIELERNAKSELDYYSRFLSYKSSPYTHVIYFCETEKIFKVVVEQSSTFQNSGVALILSPDRIFQRSSGFATLQSFLK